MRIGKARSFTPYSGLASLSADAVLRTNFPGCKVFFKMQEAAGEMSLKNSVDSSRWIQAPDAIYPVPVENNYFHMTGMQAWPFSNTSGFQVPLNKHTVLITVSWSNALPVVGGCDFQRINEPIATFSHNAAGTTAAGIINTCYLNADNTSHARVKIDRANGLVAGAVVYKPGTANELGYYFVDSNGYGAGTPIFSSGETGIGSGIDADMNIAYLQDRVEINCGFDAGSEIKMYGIMMYQFDTVPSDMKVALEWMRQNWSSGNKAIYPGWRGL